MVKRGQITIFVIIGIFLLLSAGIIFYLTRQSDVSDTMADRALLQTVPEFALPLQRFVEQCNQETLQRAVQIAGIQGGLIYPEELGLEFNYNAQTESDGVKIFQGGDLKVPYWRYIRGDSECTQGCINMLAVPSLEGEAPGTIQSQIETFIKRNILDCLDAQDRINSLGMDYEILDDLDVEVEFGDRDVISTLYYPLRVEALGETFDLLYYNSKVDIPFREYYDNALFLSVMIDNTSLFEKATLELISVYSGMDSASLPPMTGSDLKFRSSVSWNLFSVKENLFEIIISNIPKFTVTSSRNFQPIDSFYDITYYPIKSQFYSYFQIPGIPEFALYDIDFIYGGWNMYMNINDGSPIIRPESLSMDWFPFFGINRIRTMYSVSYPLIVSLSNPDDRFPGGDNFVFNFGTEVNIRNNAIMSENYETFDYSIFDDFLPETTFLCDDDMRTSGDIIFRIINGKTGEPEPGVELGYICGEESCRIETTDESGEFKGPLPVCEGGYIQALKDGFETIFFEVSPRLEDTLLFNDIIIEPYRYRNVTIKNYLVTKMQGSNWLLSAAQPSYQLPEEQSILILERRNDPASFLYKEDYSILGVFEGGEKFEMQLLPGIYSGNIQGILDEKVRIHPQERCVSGSMFSGDECFYVPDQLMVLDSYSGIGAVFDERSGYLYIDKDKLDASKEIVFYQFFVDLPGIPEYSRVIEDLDALDQINDFSVRYRSRLNPTYVN